MRPFLPLLVIFLISSCGSKPTVNTDFEMKYGKSIEEIQAQRMEPQQRRFMNVVPSNQSSDWRDENFDPNSYFPHADMSHFDKKKLPQVFTPNGQESRVYVGEKIPDDMFVISYNLKNHSPYKKIGAEFDGIEIPDEDFYQVKTESSDKSYLLVKDDQIRNNLARTRKERSDQDIKNSEVIIAEYKEKTREEKMLNIFDEKKTEEVKKSEAKKLEEKKKKITKKVKKPQPPKPTSFRAKESS